MSSHASWPTERVDFPVPVALALRALTVALAPIDTPRVVALAELRLRPVLAGERSLVAHMVAGAVAAIAHPAGSDGVALHHRLPRRFPPRRLSTSQPAVTSAPPAGARTQSRARTAA